MEKYIGVCTDTSGIFNLNAVFGEKFIQLRYMKSSVSRLK